MIQGTKLPLQEGLIDQMMRVRTDSAHQLAEQERILGSPKTGPQCIRLVVCKVHQPGSNLVAVMSKEHLYVR